jgi:hypothetical protein
VARLHNGFWIGVTIVLSVVFAALLFPAVHDRYGFLVSALLILVGLVVIWAVYLIRAYVFGRVDERDE